MDVLKEGKIPVSPTRAPERIRVCLLDDHKVLSQGLAMMLGGEIDIEVVGQCYKIADAIQVALSQPVDLFLIDLRLEGEDGFTLVERLREMEHPGRVLILAAQVEPADLVRLVSLGVSGIVLKNSPPETLLGSIRSVAAGEAWLSQDHLNALLQELSKNHSESQTTLTEREREVLRSLLQGLSNKEIAERLGVRESTVKFLLQNLFHKNGVHTRSQLVRVALEKYRGELLT